MLKQVDSVRGLKKPQQETTAPRNFRIVCSRVTSMATPTLLPASGYINAPAMTNESNVDDEINPLTRVAYSVK